MPASTQPSPTRRDMETRLIEKCWKDPDFKKEVITDPKGTFERHFGQKLPASLDIKIHEEDANTLHFSIPPAPANFHELSQEELERVAGGTDIFITLSIAAGLVTALSVVGSIGAGLQASGTTHW